jgi:hypothetical protein
MNNHLIAIQHSDCNRDKKLGYFRWKVPEQLDNILHSLELVYSASLKLLKNL